MKTKRSKTLFTTLSVIVLAMVMCFTAVACKSSVNIWQPSDETDASAYGATALDGDINFDYETIPREALRIYVSPQGNNANGGLSPKTAVYSIKQAQIIARNYIAMGMFNDCAIILADGEYFLSSTMEIGYSDVPTGGKLFLRSENPNGATITGSKRVNKSTVVEIENDEKLGRVWKIPYSGENPVQQLYINEDYATRARYPDAGEQLRLLNWDNALKRIIIDVNDLADFSNEDLIGSSFVAEIMWAESYIRIKDIVRDEKTARIETFSQDMGVFARTSPSVMPRQSYYFENSKAFLNERGEFWYSEDEKVIYYLPRESETLENTVIRVPYTEELLKIKGDINYPINGINIEGINFMYSGNAHLDGKLGNQANKDDGINKRFSGSSNDGRPYSAVTLEYVKNARIVGNKFACLGGGALDFTEGVQYSEVSKNLFRSVGGNAILGGAIHYSIDMVKRQEGAYIKDIVVEDNYFNDIAWQEYGGCAVCLNYCLNGKVSYNTINNTKYSAISVGWGWSNDAYPFLANNEISYNRISCPINLMSDGSAIYLVGCQPNSEVFSNYIEYIYDSPWKFPNDMKEFDHPKWGLSAIYLDQGVGGTGADDKVRVYNNYIFEGDAEHFFTGNAKYDDKYKPLFEITEIEENNKQTVKDESGADKKVFRSIYGKAKIFGSYIENETQVTVFGEALKSDNCILVLKNKEGKLTALDANDVVYWSKNKITFKTENYSSGEAFILSRDGTTSNRLILTLNVNVQYEKYDRFTQEWDGQKGLALLVATQLGLDPDGYKSSSVESGWPESNIYDDNTFTGWSCAFDDTNPWILFKLKKEYKISWFILYARDGEDQEMCRKHLEIYGYDKDGNDYLLFATEGDNPAYLAGGALIINVAESEYKDVIFSSFKICRPEGVAEEDAYLFIAEVAIIK